MVCVIFESSKQDILLPFPDAARVMTKRNLRQGLIDRLAAQKQEDLDYHVDFITGKTIQKSLGFYLQALQKKAKSAPPRQKAQAVN